MKHPVLLILLIFTAPIAFACTGFFKEIDGQVYFAANEDWYNPYTKIWTMPADDDNYGLLLLGFANMSPQTIINDQGLAMDGFSTELLEVKETRGKKIFKGNLFLEVFKKCATVDEALKMISEYNLDFLSIAQILIGDKTGDSALIEGDVIQRKEGSYQVATNFYLSKTENITCYRYNLASKYLDNENFSESDLSTVLQDTRQHMLTQYSYIFNLTKGTMELFFFGDFETSRTFNINHELNKRSYVINIPELYEKDVYYNLSLLTYLQMKPQKSDIPIEDISNYTGYYHYSNWDMDFDIIESGDSLICVIDGYEFKMIPANDNIFFFEELDHTLHFQKKSSMKVYGVDVKYPYLGINQFAKKIHPIWAWFYR